MKLSRAFMLDGKPVLCWLFMYRMKATEKDRRTEFLVQVQAFSIDHAKERVKEYAEKRHKVSLPARDLLMVEELDPEHDVGALGHFLPLLPNGAIYQRGNTRLN